MAALMPYADLAKRKKYYREWFLRTRPARVMKAIARKEARVATNLIPRFLSFTHPEPNSGCWLWEGGEIGNGYGKFWMSNRTEVAHRAGFILFNGPIPPGKEIDHKCRVKSCVNPNHLQALTHTENQRRRLLPFKRRRQ